MSGLDCNDGDEVVVEILPTIRVYRSGRVERLQPTDFVPASPDPKTAVQSKDVSINNSTGLSARLYLPTTTSSGRKFPIFVFFHGGGFCIGSAFSSLYHSYLNRLVSRAQVLAVSVDFRLAPEHPLPAAYDDSWEALQWVARAGSGNGNPEPWLAESAYLDQIYLAGDSTGANIAHNIAVRLGRNNSPVEGLILMHPYFWGKEKIGSEREEKEGVMLKSKDADALWPFVCPETTGLDDPRVNPMAEGSPSLAALGCRRVQVSVAGRDLLRERGKLYFEKLKQSGWEGEAEFWETEGEDHVFFLLYPQSVKAEEFMERLIKFLIHE